jgi:hypothetical protein
MSIDLRLWYAYDFFRKSAETLKGFFVWRFSLFHVLASFAWLCESNSIFAKDKTAWDSCLIPAAVRQRIFASTFTPIFASRENVNLCLMVVQRLDVIFIQDRPIELDVVSTLFPWCELKLSQLTMPILQGLRGNDLGKSKCEVLKITCDPNSSGILDEERNNWILPRRQSFQSAVTNDDVRTFLFMFGIRFVEPSNTEMAEVKYGQCNSGKWKIQNPIFVREVVQKTTEKERKDSANDDDACRAHQYSPWFAFCISIGFAAGFIYALFVVRRSH